MKQEERSDPISIEPPKKTSKKRVRMTKDARRRQIAEATIRVVAKYGVPGATVSRIAAEASLSKGALYQHFRNREEVLAASIDLLGERAADWLVRPSGPNVLQDLVDLGEAHSSWVDEHMDNWIRPIYQIIASNADPEVTDLVHQWQQKDIHALINRVRAGQQQGSVKSDVESADVAWCVIALAWAEDVARMMGAEEFIEEGASRRILRRLLETYAEAPSPPTS